MTNQGCDLAMLAARAERAVAGRQDKDATIAFLQGEVARLQSRVSELGAELADAKSWQNTHRSKTIPKGRT